MKVGDLVKFDWWLRDDATRTGRVVRTGVITIKHPPSMRIAVRGDAFDVLVFCTGRPHMFRTLDLEVINESR